MTRRRTGDLDGDGTEYLGFSVRFEWDTDKDNTLQKASDKFKNKVSWVSLTYHECDHDETNRGGCSWDERWEWTAKDVTLPADIDALLPDSDSVTVVSA